ncbi:sensor histidine kinase [Variovorax sp. RHLX14]|uniref:sensor histidine kinase n=1 Tax=Variovorax sp. RHLX14 TaxID=1259731 RepID=UPI003F4525BF
MDLREELTRQGLLLDFLSACVSSGNVADLVKLIASRLHWICDYESCAAFLPGKEALQLWSHNRRPGAEDPVHDEVLRADLKGQLDQAMLKRSPVVANLAETGRSVVALPLGTATAVLGALCLCRSTGNFPQGDVRHLQHACSAVGGALTRIAALNAEQEAEHAMTVAEARLRAAAEDRALLAEQMVGIVSHDLRNPLSAILMGTTLLGKGEPLPPQKERVLQKMNSAGRRAQRLVDDLLDFTQARMGRGLALRMQEADVMQLISSAVDELRLSFPALEFRASGRGVGSAYLDADRIHQLLGNLVANASTYGTAGTPIVLHMDVCDAQLTLSVQNQGDPIKEAVMDSMFEPMVRGEQERMNRSVGLGLYIVRAIVQSHHGNIQVTSTKKDGTCFAVRLPIRSRPS